MPQETQGARYESRDGDALEKEVSELSLEGRGRIETPEVNLNFYPGTPSVQGKHLNQVTEVRLCAELYVFSISYFRSFRIQLLRAC